jgi:flagellin-specific chaperone FliS
MDTFDKATSVQLVGLLYKRAVRDLNESINADPKRALELVLHADAIVRELCNALNPASGEFAANLLKMYELVRTHLLAAGTGGREKMVDEAKRALDILQPLSEAWDLVVAEEAKRGEKDALHRPAEDSR